PYRLLSEAEWEYAARAGSPAAYPWGPTFETGHANCAVCGHTYDNTGTVPVDSFEANKFGLKNMIGNVWEWVQDCYDDTYSHTPTDGSPFTRDKCTEHIARGGSWNNGPPDLRSAARMNMGADYRTSVGFRVARTIAK